MKSFRIEKVIRTSSTCVSDSRLGTIQFSFPSSSVENRGNCGGDDVSSGNGKGEDAEKVASSSSSVISEELSSYRTPMYLIHTQSGSIPHITPEVLKLIYPTSAPTPSHVPPVQISIDSTEKCVDSVEKFGKGIARFVGLPSVPTFLTIHDPLQPFKSGHNDKFGIALWSRHGRASLTPERFLQTVKGYKPSLCQILSDYDVRPESSGMKRLKKSLSRAEEYTDLVVKEKSSGKFDSGTGLFITIEAAWFEMNEELARKTVATLLESQHQIEGVVIAGLTDRFGKSGDANASGGDKKPAREQSKLRICDDLNIELLSKICQVIPSGLPKYVPGPFGLPQMVDLISQGVDILDSSVTSKMADDAEVFLLDQVETILDSISTSVKSISGVENEGLPERCGNNDDLGDGAGQISCEVSSAVFSLKDKRFFDDFRPLSNTCTCYTCRKHTRSYVHHLYVTDELLGPVLVQIHNLTATDRFFQIIRGLLQDTDSPEDTHDKFMTIKRLVSKESNSKTDDESKSSSNDSQSDKVLNKVNKE